MYEKMKINFGNFIAFYRDYFKGNRTREDMTLISTQPFWQSIILSKKRLDEKGLTMDIEYEDERKSRIGGEVFKTSSIDISKVDISNVTDNQKNISATLRKQLNVTQRVVRSDKVLYEEKGNKIVSMSQVKEKVASDMVVCPNCGHEGTISSYIDGCDYCHTKFNVMDFEEKVSSFNIEQDYDKDNYTKYVGILKKTAKALAAFLILTIVLLIARSVDNFTHSVDLKLTEWFAIFMRVSLIFAVISGGIFLLAGVTVIVARNLFYGKNIRRVKGSTVLEDIHKSIPNFSEETFAQELEMKLRSIHFTDRADNVNVFANIDLTEVISQYNNVIDCNVTGIEFLEFTENAYTYEISVNVKMKLLKYDGKEVKKGYESIVMTLSGRKDMVENTLSVTMYKCDSCGSSISLLNGGVCTHCGQRLPYEKYSFIIESYVSNLEGIDDLKRKDRKLTAGFILSSIAVICISLYICRFFIQEMTHYLDFAAHCQEEYDTVQPLGDVDNSVTEVSAEIGYVDRRYIYECEESAVETAKIYQQYLIAKGFEEYITNENIYRLLKETYYDIYGKIYIEIVIRIDEDELMIENTIRHGVDK